MSIKLAPFYVVKLTIKGDPGVSTFMGNMIRRFWMKAIPKITRAFWYTRSGGEVVYRLSEGQQEFWDYKDVYPSDISILCRGRVPVGINVKPQNSSDDPSVGVATSMYNVGGYSGEPEAKPISLFFPKGFLYLHNREFNSLQGQSEFESAYEAWTEKSDTQGAKHSRKLWFYKNAFSGGILFHPPGSFRNEQNQEIPFQALARQALETSLNGSVWTFEQSFDPVSGQPLWSYVEPKMQPGGEKILEYVRHLDNEIMRGLGIPDDVVQQISGTGSYAGRSIPLMAFFIAQRATLTNLFTICDEQVFRPLCRANFGHDNYEASMEIDIERLMGAMDGKPNGPGMNEAAYQNPNANPMQHPGNQHAQGQHQFGNSPALQATMGVFNVDLRRSLMSTVDIFNGIWDSSIEVHVNPQSKSGYFILSV